MDESVDLTQKLRLDPRLASNGMDAVAVRMRRVPDEYDRDITQLNIIFRKSATIWTEGTFEFLIYDDDGFISQTRRLFLTEGLDPDERQIVETMYDVSGMARADLTFAPDDIDEDY